MVSRVLVWTDYVDSLERTSFHLFCETILYVKLVAIYLQQVKYFLSSQARCQDFAAGGPKTARGDTSLNTLLDVFSKRGAKHVNKAAQTLNGGSGTTAPPRDGPVSRWCVQAMTHVTLGNCIAAKSDVFMCPTRWKILRKFNLKYIS